ncbi:MAG: hypothetical protein AAGB03_10965, partial [Pseudomonadota bacterium]
MIKRRAILAGLGTSAAFLSAPAAWARATIQTSSRGTVSICDNTGVLTSGVEGRLSGVADFGLGDMCQLTPDTVEGPYFICDGVASAREITGGKPGQPLTVALRVVDQTCTPIPGAFVDIWHCDALGFYSGHDIDPDNITADREALSRTRVPDLPERFLRGVLATDVDGIAEFDMIYPSFYDSRAIHTHYKVHIGNQAFVTAQALYPEEFNTQVLAQAPYNTSRSTARILNANDARVIVE